MDIAALVGTGVGQFFDIPKDALLLLSFDPSWGVVVFRFFSFRIDACNMVIRGGGFECALAVGFGKDLGGGAVGEEEGGELDVFDEEFLVLVRTALMADA